MAAALGLLRSRLPACLAATGNHGSPMAVVPRCLAPQLPAPSRMVSLFSSRLYATKPGGKGPPVPQPPVEVVPEFDEDEDMDGDFDPMEDMPVAVQRRVYALKDIQTQYDEMAREYLRELATLQDTYQKKYAPLYDQRKAIVSGAAKVETYDIPDDGEPDEGRIPEFWLTALRNHDKIGSYITERDAEVLQHLVDIRTEVLTGDFTGFKLHFTFEDNKFMKNKVLTKTYELENEEEVIPRRFLGCKIEWSDVSMDPTIEQRKKRVKAAAKGGKPTFATESVPCESFFNLFDPPQVPENPDELDDEAMDSLQEELSADFDIGYSIKDQVIPRAVEWFTGEIAPMDDEYMGDEFEDDGEDDDDMFEDDAPKRGGPKGRGFDGPPPPMPPAGKGSRR